MVRCSCGFAEPYAKFHDGDLKCTRCRKEKRVDLMHANTIREMKKKLEQLEQENALLLDDKKFLKSIIKEKSREVSELESVRVECDGKLEQMEEEIYALKSTQHVLDIRTKEMGSMLSMNNMGLAGYMTKVDEMKKEVSEFATIMDKQMELNHNMTTMLNKCVVREDYPAE
jgi:chromosome segregation ATPase